jgi:hypothetical protein
MRQRNCERTTTFRNNRIYKIQTKSERTYLQDETAFCFLVSAIGPNKPNTGKDKDGDDDGFDDYDCFGEWLYLCPQAKHKERSKLNTYSTLLPVIYLKRNIHVANCKKLILTIHMYVQNIFNELLEKVTRKD